MQQTNFGVMNGLADIDRFKICIQVCMWLGFPPLISNLHQLFIAVQFCPSNPVEVGAVISRCIFVFTAKHTHKMSIPSLYM